MSNISQRKLKKWYKVSEAAEYMGLTAHTVRELVHEKKLKAKIKSKTHWLLNVDDLDRYMKKLPEFKGMDKQAI